MANGPAPYAVLAAMIAWAAALSVAPWVACRRRASGA